MVPAQNMVVDTAAISQNGSAPHCEHLDGLAPVTPLLDACRDHADRQAPLVVCLTCGWVACSDDSPGGHARAHYEETDHRWPPAWNRDRGGDGATSTSVSSDTASLRTAVTIVPLTAPATLSCPRVVPAAALPLISSAAR